jgi:hypothetical protein
MPRTTPSRTRTPPIHVTPEPLAEWQWLSANDRRNGDRPQPLEWIQRWKKFNAAVRCYWPEMAGPLEAKTDEPPFDPAHQPERFETWKQGRAWREALEAAER